MKSPIASFALLVCMISLSTRGATGAVVLSEILYNSAAGGQYEFVEIHNTGPDAADIGNWGLRNAVTYTFPDGTVIPAGAYFVVCKSKSALGSAFPELPAEVLFGDYAGALANEGETLVLSSAAGVPVEILTYDDDPPWEFLADGFGASLERTCFTADPSLPENWRASASIGTPDIPGGSPGAANSASVCPPVQPPRPRVYVSEIMYHPVLEESFEDEHEFVEIHSEEPAALSLAGWRVAGAVDYTFPAGATIAAGGYAVIAKNKSQLAQVASYGLNAADLFGNYARTLDNGGEKIALISSDGQGVDSVSYDDDFPWPIAADALGAGEDWLRPALLPVENHRYRGYSLERVSFDFPSGDVANWAPSPLDGATPGRPNAAARGVPLPIVTDILVQPRTGTDPLIRSSDEAWMQLRFSPEGLVAQAQVEYFIEDLTRTGEPVAKLALTDDGGPGDLIAGDGTYSALFPPRPDNTIVRYRVLADRGGGLEVVSPRSTDPLDWHSYFVSPLVDTQTQLYAVFISPSNWGQMWRNIEGGRVSGCTVRTQWDAKVPAVLVHEGQVFDARVRYHGSRYNRWNGPDIGTWPYSRPDYGPLRALSWRISVPRYTQLEGRDVIILNKLTQGCPGYSAAVGFELFARADLPAPLTRYARLHLNGGYYHYMIEYEHGGEEMMRRYHAEQAEKYPDRPAEEVGLLYKSTGCDCDEGPFGWGDERVLNAYCGFSKAQRYRYTYEPRTWEWAPNDEMVLMIEDLNAARSSLPNTEALRVFFEERFDLDLLLSYLAIMNWAVPFDDMFQNHYLYQRAGDGRWVLFPWDLDLNFGGWKGASASLYMGEQNDPDNRSGWWNYLKDGFLKAYRSEYEARLLLFTNTILHPDAVSQMVDDVTAQANPTEAAQAASPIVCDFASGAASFKSFARQRHQVVNDRLASVRVDAGPDQTVIAGAVVQFDARSSRPDPGPDVTYVWDNGMNGDFPTFVYATPGVYVVTLTITVAQVPYRDSVKITVIPAPEKAFAEDGGQVVFEAEHFYLNEPHGATAVWWEEGNAQLGYSGDGYMEARFTSYQKYASDYAGTAPELRFAIRFESTGDYRVWIRGLSSSQDADSCHVGLDGAERDESFAQRFTIQAGTFNWSVDTRGQGPQVVTVSTPGIHFLSIWVRESGQIVDKVLLTTDAGFTPTGAGPPESAEVPVVSHPAFVRGDSNGDSIVDISDAVSILLHLFAGAGSLICDDHGDADDNGSLQVTDAVAILNFLFRGGPPPRAPFPAAGWDTTTDSQSCGDKGG